MPKASIRLEHAAPFPRASDWVFEMIQTRTRSGSDGSRASGHLRIKLRTVPADHCVVAHCRSLRWHHERDADGGLDYCSYKALRAERRGRTEVWVVGTRVSGGSGEPESTEPIAERIGVWPQMVSAGREA